MSLFNVFSTLVLSLNLGVEHNLFFDPGPGNKFAFKNFFSSILRFDMKDIKFLIKYSIFL